MGEVDVLCTRPLPHFCSPRTQPQHAHAPHGVAWGRGGGADKRMTISLSHCLICVARTNFTEEKLPSFRAMFELCVLRTDITFVYYTLLNIYK